MEERETATARHPRGSNPLPSYLPRCPWLGCVGGSVHTGSNPVTENFLKNLKIGGAVKWPSFIRVVVYFLYIKGYNRGGNDL